MVSILYTTQGQVLKKLIAIVNHTTGGSYVLPAPAPSPTYLISTHGTVSALVFLSLLLSGANLWLVSLLSVAGLFAYVKLVNAAELSSPPLQVDNREEARLLADQKLIAQQWRLKQRVEELRGECLSNQRLIGQLESLKRKMLDLDAQLYGRRVTRTNSAVEILKQQIINNQRLVTEYLRTTRMIDIELETSQIADQLPEAEDFTSAILGKLNELQRVEDQNQSLRFQLEANEEVRRLRG